MSFDFSYILEKIADARFIDIPFPHLDIKNLLSDEHLDIIIKDKQIHFEEMQDIESLYQRLIDNKYSIQVFPGCTSNWKKYLEYLDDMKKALKNGFEEKYKSSNPVENVGITFRLRSISNPMIDELLRFMNSDAFHDTLKKKFAIVGDTDIISAVQKNLTGYEISPHPDIRRKALTYLLNINKDKEIEKLDCHTHLLRLKKEKSHVEDFWKDNETTNRCWIPWEWCDTIKTINENNSLVIFRPNSSPPSLHAIRLNYDHLKYQRTQIYGNLNYSRPPRYKDMVYTEFL